MFFQFFKNTNKKFLHQLTRAKINTKGHSSLVWYSIDREDQSNESIFLYKRRIGRLDQNYKEWYQFGTEWASLTYFFYKVTSSIWRCFWFVNLLSSGSWLIIDVISTSCFHLELGFSKNLENYWWKFCEMYCFFHFSGHTISDLLFWKRSKQVVKELLRKN